MNFAQRAVNAVYVLFAIYIFFWLLMEFYGISILALAFTIPGLIFFYALSYFELTFVTM